MEEQRRTGKCIGDPVGAHRARSNGGVLRGHQARTSSSSGGMSGVGSLTVCYTTTCLCTSGRGHQRTMSSRGFVNHLLGQLLTDSPRITMHFAN